MKVVNRIVFIVISSTLFATSVSSSENLKFTDVSNSIFSGICENPPDQGFGHPMAEWETGIPYLFSFDHWNARHNHCAYKWNGKQFVLLGNNSPKNPIGLSGDISYGTNTKHGCCGWTVEMLDIDGDGDLDLHGRSTEGADGYFENTGPNSAKWRN